MSQTDRTVDNLGPFFRPVSHYDSPAGVLNDARLSTDEKRVILSSWASDMYVVESHPALREVPGIPQRLRLDDPFTATSHVAVAVHVNDQMTTTSTSTSRPRSLARRRPRLFTRHKCVPPLTSAVDVVVDVVVDVDGDGDVRRGRGRIALGTVSPHNFARNAGLVHARAAAGSAAFAISRKGVVNGHVAVAVAVAVARQRPRPRSRQRQRLGLTKSTTGRIYLR